MKIVVHDFSGHPFQVALSRAMARREHQVVHLYSAEFQSPKGPLERRDDDPESFSSRPVDSGHKFRKYGRLTRASDELRYGRQLVSALEELQPDVVLSSNTPLLSQWLLLQARTRLGFAMVHWWQDVQSLAARHQFGNGRLKLVADILERIERQIVREAEATIGITPAFAGVARQWDAVGSKYCTIPNWSPVEEIPQLPRENDWAVELGLSARPRFLYAGTLGLKHNPELLARLAENLSGIADVIVASQGLGATYLREQIAARRISNLRLLDFQPFHVLPQMLGASDVLMAIIEPDAGEYAVPSKVLTYLCAGRPLLLSLPVENLASQTVAEAEAGIMARPDDPEGFIRGARDLLRDPALRARLGKNARTYAESVFDIDSICDRFLDVIDLSLRR